MSSDLYLYDSILSVYSKSGIPVDINLVISVTNSFLQNSIKKSIITKLTTILMLGNI